MIDIKELRIGNLIDKNGIAARIEVINNEIDEVYFVANDFYNRDFCCNIKPIPLTEELIIVFNKNSIFNNGYTYKRTITDRFEIYADCCLITVIEFLHEFQNLNFALLGEEVEETNH